MAIEEAALQMNTSWFSVRCVFSFHDSYEERITIWQCKDMASAIAFAEAEATDYAASSENISFLGLLQGFAMEDPPTPGAEVFSLIRESNLSPDQYLDTYFDTGREHQSSVGRVE